MAVQTAINLNSTTPAAPAGQQNIVFQADPNANITAHDLPMAGDAGSGGAGGNVPAPQPGDAAAGKFLKADGTWSAPPAQVNSDWTATQGVSQVLNKPTLGTAAALNVGTTTGTVAAGDDPRLTGSVTSSTAIAYALVLGG
jgi:hypothetical protein